MKKPVILALLAISMLIISGTAMANTNIVNANNEPPLEQTGELGRVVWEQGIVEAMGTGIPPAHATNPTQKKMLARRAAVIDAYRNLAETTKGVQIDSQSTVQDLVLTNDTINAQVSGVIQGARVVREIPGEDGSYSVIVSMNMYGPGSLAQTAFNAIKPVKVEQFPTPSKSYEPDTTGVAAGEYTGVIIVAQNMGLKPTFSPRVYDESNNIVYGNKYIDPDFAIQHGMVDYSNLDTAMTGNSRAGNKPLVVNALKVVDHNCNVVISNADAQKILAAHAKSNFLARCSVVFSR